MKQAAETESPMKVTLKKTEKKQFKMDEVDVSKGVSEGRKQQTVPPYRNEAFHTIH